MLDSSGTPETSAAPLKISLSADGRGLDITPDPAWISDPARVFPVTLDPTYDGFGTNGPGYMDDFVYAGTPNTNYNSWTESGYYVDKAGYSPSYVASNEHYTYLYEDLNALNNKQVLDGRLKMYMLNSSSSVNLHVHPVSPSSWSASTMTWNNKPGHRVDDIAVRPPANAWTNIDLTSWVSNWTNGTWQNSGLSFDTAGQNAYYRWWSVETLGSQPYVHVTYNDLPPAATLVGPDDSAQLMTTTPTLSANPVSDPNGDTMKYWFRVSSTTNPESGQIINSGWQTSPTWSVPPGSLINGVTYSWYVITWDGNVQNVYQGSAVRKLKVNFRLGDQAASPTDTEGPVKVNLANGNLTTAISSPSFKTLDGDIGLSYSYNSQAQPTAGLTGRYYAACTPDQQIQGRPNPYIQRADSAVNFNWGLGSPGTAIDVDNFCASWDGFISAPRANTYCFGGSSDDGMRIWVNNQLVWDRWTDGGGATPGSNPPSCTQLWPTTVPIHIEYYEHGGGASLDARVSGPNVPDQTIPASWLSTTPSSLPLGWQLSAGASTDELAYTKAIVTDSAVVLVDPSGDTHEFKKTGSGSTIGFTPPADDRTTLILVPGSSSPNYLAQGDDGLTYTFNEKGALASVVSSTDDRSPAAAQYVYDPAADIARLSAIKDPVSGRQLGLKYSTGLFGGSPCADAPSGFASQGPAGMLCGIDYPDGTKTVLYYSAADQTGQLLRIVDPGNKVTDFGYDTNGLLNGLSDSLQMDWRAANSGVGAYTRVNYSAGKATSIVLASPNGTDSTDVPPTTNRPWHGYTYTTPFSPSTGGESRVSVGEFSPTQGFARKILFNQYAQTTSDVDATGVMTTNVWDTADRLLSTKNESTELMSTTIYDPVRNGNLRSCAGNVLYGIHTKRQLRELRCRAQHYQLRREHQWSINRMVGQQGPYWNTHIPLDQDSS